MRKLLFVSLLAGALSTHSQTSVSRMLIQGGRDAWPNYLKEIYLNPDFEDGFVEFNNGQRFKSRLNYNRALGTIQFIDEKGDTLALSDETAVAWVTIGTTKFYMLPLCLQEMVVNQEVILAKNEKIKIADKQKPGAMGIPNSQGTIESYDRSYTRNNHYIDINEQLLLRKTTAYYVAAKDRKFVPASRKNVLHLFPQLKQYIGEHHIDFGREEDLIHLLRQLDSR